MKRWLARGSCVLACSLIVADAQAQQENCFWPGSQPRCISWFITEAGVYRRFTDLLEDDERTLFLVSFGWMRNVSKGTGLGAELFGGVEGEARGGIAVRMRQWLSRGMTVDAIAGVHLLGDASSQDVAAGSPMMTFRFGYADKIAAAVRLDVLKLRCKEGCSPSAIPNPDATSTRFYLGLETGSKVGAAFVVLGGLLIGAAAATFEF